MPRLARLDAPGLLQHVMARGIERRELFRDKKDRKSFLDRLAIILEETKTQCYAWALIPNHFHLLLRTGPAPLSKVMRRLMTGYAVTFNKRHKRSGHLFQNRYKSIVCEEDAYLLELIRYIHLNPLRAGLVRDLKELDKYPWTGHSAMLGRRKNPLIPKQPVINSVLRPSPMFSAGHIDHTGVKGDASSSGRSSAISSSGESQKFLAEKTIEDILLYFGNNLSVARKRYRHFVKEAVDQGSRPDLQGGGLLRSAGGDKRNLLGRKKEDREMSDQRILGSGEFVSNVLKETNEVFEERSKYNISIGDLICRVCSKFDIEPGDLISSSRKRQLSHVRAIVCYLAVKELSYSGVRVGKELKISGKGVSKCLERGKKFIDNTEITGEYLL